ncbi:LOW QUALITY PROTEIN: hypothetical protein HID58_031339, partial [Brassica napus]
TLRQRIRTGTIIRNNGGAKAHARSRLSPDCPRRAQVPYLSPAVSALFFEVMSGILNWVEAQATSTEIRLGDVYGYVPVQFSTYRASRWISSLEPNLRFTLSFPTARNVYMILALVRIQVSQISCLVLMKQFSNQLLGADEEPYTATMIVHDMLTTPGEANTDTDTNTWPLQTRLLKLFSGDASADSVENKKRRKKEKKKKPKKATTFNVFESQPDFQSPNGQTITINRKDLKVLQGSMVGVSMVNLTQGSMMGPHWNPWACEISVVVRGSGMVRVLRNSISRSSSECKNMRFKRKEIFSRSTLHPMAQMSFLNDSLVFVGFTTSAKNNEPQFLAGKNSVLWSLDREVLAASFNVSSFMIAGLLEAQKEAAVLGCPACAEGELEKLKEDEEKKCAEAPAQQPPQPPQGEPQNPARGAQKPPQGEPEGPQKPFQPQPGQGEPQEPQASMETKMRDEERKREEEEAKKEEEERWKQEEKLWPTQPQWED